MDGETVLKVRDLRKVHGSGSSRVEALRGVDFAVRRGEFVSLMGASGSGKSTLLHLLAGLDRPSGGNIFLGETDLVVLGEDERAELRRRRLGLVFQSFQLLDTLDAEENVALPLTIAGCPAVPARQRAYQALACVGLEHRRSHRPDQLSGGEQQRVAIARALVIEPMLLLADEPTGNLDERQGEQIMDLFYRLVEEHRQTLLLVTHNADHAARAGRMLLLRDGRLLERPPSEGAAWTVHRLDPSRKVVILPTPIQPDLGGAILADARPRNED
jgi:putative ABC transport system ATP-binding protein